ncbi:unnamed protein product [Effrenium voratum]|uniref:Uncharacterized protein n=1 Tax=Effrenium voratum TaxID=2562239 RepID=A0AA36NFG8_9DINO|nr:unnamed protein product [Effrenium voratum]
MPTGGWSGHPRGPLRAKTTRSAETARSAFVFLHFCGLGQAGERAKVGLMRWAARAFGLQTNSSCQEMQADAENRPRRHRCEVWVPREPTPLPEQCRCSGAWRAVLASTRQESNATNRGTPCRWKGRLPGGCAAGRAFFFASCARQRMEFDNQEASVMLERALDSVLASADCPAPAGSTASAWPLDVAQVLENLRALKRQTLCGSFCPKLQWSFEGGVFHTLLDPALKGVTVKAS